MVVLERLGSEKRKAFIPIACGCGTGPPKGKQTCFSGACFCGLCCPCISMWQISSKAKFGTGKLHAVIYGLIRLGSIVLTIYLSNFMVSGYASKSKHQEITIGNADEKAANPQQQQSAADPLGVNGIITALMGKYFWFVILDVVLHVVNFLLIMYWAYALGAFLGLKEKLEICHQTWMLFQMPCYALVAMDETVAVVGKPIRAGSGGQNDGDERRPLREDISGVEGGEEFVEESACCTAFLCPWVPMVRIARGVDYRNGVVVGYVVFGMQVVLKIMVQLIGQFQQREMSGIFNNAIIQKYQYINLAISIISCVVFITAVVMFDVYLNKFYSKAKTAATISPRFWIILAVLTAIGCIGCQMMVVTNMYSELTGTIILVLPIVKWIVFPLFIALGLLAAQLNVIDGLKQIRFNPRDGITVNQYGSISADV